MGRVLFVSGRLALWFWGAECCSVLGDTGVAGATQEQLNHKRPVPTVGPGLHSSTPATLGLVLCYPLTVAGWQPEMTNARTRSFMPGHALWCLFRGVAQARQMLPGGR